MDNKTPPAWIRNLTKELLSLVPGVHNGDDRYPAIRDNWQRIITERAPDADAVADCLEYILELGRKDTSNPKYDGYYESAHSILTAYRSQHPKG